MFAFIKAITQIHQVPQPNKPFASLLSFYRFLFRNYWEVRWEIVTLMLIVFGMERKRDNYGWKVEQSSPRLVG
jgi:uncharacterized membrane protein